MTHYQIKIGAEFIFGLITAAAVAGSLVVKQGDPTSAMVTAAIAGGIARYVAANLQNILAALTGPEPDPPA